MSDPFLKIRPLRAEDISALEAVGHRAPGLAAHRFGEQERHISLVFLALVDDHIVGHAILTWEGDKLPDCPNIYDVWVRPNWRRQGIGGALLEACEHVARDQGFYRVGLGVGVDNVGANALYASHGYREAGLPIYEDSGRWTAANGELVEWNEVCRYLVRDLRDGPMPKSVE